MTGVGSFRRRYKVSNATSRGGKGKVTFVKLERECSARRLTAWPPPHSVLLCILMLLAPCSPCPKAVPAPPCLSSSSESHVLCLPLSLFTQAHWLSFRSWTPEHHSGYSLPGDVSEHIPEPLMSTRPHSPIRTTPHSPIAPPFQTSDPQQMSAFLRRPPATPARAWLSESLML